MVLVHLFRYFCCFLILKQFSKRFYIKSTYDDFILLIFDKVFYLVFVSRETNIYLIIEVDKLKFVAFRYIVDAF